MLRNVKELKLTMEQAANKTQEVMRAHVIKQQTEITELKNLLSQMKNLLKCLISKGTSTEDRRQVA